MDKSHDKSHLPPAELMADLVLISELAIFFREKRKRMDVSAALLTIAAASLQKEDLEALTKVLVEFAEKQNCHAVLEKVGGDKPPEEPIMPTPVVTLSASDYGPQEHQNN